MRLILTRMCIEISAYLKTKDDTVTFDKMDLVTNFILC